MDSLVTVPGFEAWLDHALGEQVPETIVSFNINLYDSPFRADVVGSTYYDPGDPDWACEEAWQPQERWFDFPGELAKLPWEQRLALCKGLLQRCVAGTGPAGARFRRAVAVTVGFVDGDLEIVHAEQPGTSLTPVRGHR